MIEMHNIYPCVFVYGLKASPAQLNQDFLIKDFYITFEYVVYLVGTFFHTIHYVLQKNLPSQISP